MEDLDKKAKAKKNSLMRRLSRTAEGKPEPPLPKPVALKGHPGMDSLEDNP